MEETAKQKSIREAYGETWNSFKNNVDSNGWIHDRDFWGRWPENTGVIKWETTDHDDEYYDTRRPVILKGIEKNNGWISINSKEDLPDHTAERHVRCKDGDILILLATPNYLLKNCTHYQELKTILPPIY